MIVQRYDRPGRSLYDLKPTNCFLDEGDVWMVTDMSTQPSPVTFKCMHNQVLAVNMRTGGFRVYDAGIRKVTFPCHIQEDASP